MSRRQSIGNGYPGYYGRTTRTNYYQQPEPIPMMRNGVKQSYPIGSQYRSPPSPYNPAYSNRIAPQDYYPNHYGKNQSRAPSSIMSGRPYQPRSYYNREDPYTRSDGFYQSDDFRSPYSPNSYSSRRCCLGLSCIGGTFLFGTMIFLAAAAISGLIVSVVLYVNDSLTDPQWKILGMVVCSVMLVTVAVTFCIFLYCYKTGRIISDYKVNDRSGVLPYDNDDYEGVGRREPKGGFYPPNNEYPQIARHGMKELSPESYGNSSLPVNHRRPNRMMTPAPLPSHDYRRDFHPNDNVYSRTGYYQPTNHHMNANPIRDVPEQIGYSNSQHRTQPMNYQPTNHHTNANPIRDMPEQIEYSNSQQRTQPISYQTKTGIPQSTPRVEYIEDEEPPRIIEKRTRRFIKHPQYDIVEEIIQKPKPKIIEETVEIVEAPKQTKKKPNKPKDKLKYGNITVAPVNIHHSTHNKNDGDLNTDHFYE